MEVIRYLRKTFIKVTTSRQKLTTNDSTCEKCYTSDEKHLAKYCKCCGKKLINIKQKSLILNKRKSSFGVVRTSSPKEPKRIVKPKANKSRNVKNANLRIFSADLFSAKKTYKMNNFCVKNYHIANFIPNENQIFMEPKTVENLVCIKPKMTLNAKDVNEIITGKMKMKRRNGNRNLLKYKKNQKSSLTFFVDVASTPIKSAPITSTPVKVKQKAGVR